MNQRNSSFIIMAVVILVVFVVLMAAAGCSDTSPTGDSPTGDIDDSPAAVINFPDKFMNIAFKCMGVNGLYAHTREASPIVIPDDPMCRSGDEWSDQSSICHSTSTPANIEGSTPGWCEICACEVWISPSSQKIIDDMQPTINCVECASGLMAMEADPRIMSPTLEQIEEIRRNG